MATAQFLVHVIRATDVSGETFGIAAATAARIAGLTLGRWTYASLPVEISAASVIVGGQFDGVPVAGDLRPGRYMMSAYRQNLAGPDDLGIALPAFSQAFRTALAMPSGAGVNVRTGTRLPRSPISFDRGVPTPIPLEGEAGPAGGIGGGVLAVIAAGAVWVAGRGGGLSGLGSYTNRYGMTYAEWLAAAGREWQDRTQATHSAWLDGGDPTDWKAKSTGKPPVISFKREPLNSGGYARGKYGQYFGRGAPLYHYTVEYPNGEEDDGYIRASDRDSARAQLQAKFPGAKTLRGVS